jgi:hypothetical protein
VSIVRQGGCSRQRKEEVKEKVMASKWNRK